MAGQTDRMEALGRYVRRTAATWLRQPNVTSVGVGVKITDGEPTGEICIQFTVGRKAGLDSLGELGLRELPGSLVVDGEEVATDVVERNYATDARPVNLLARQRAAAPRKSAVDPVVPGVSIGHPATGAGTAGCVCYDAVDGTPYILANWHVLHGPGGRIGDPIVQPGRHDDNRVDRNRVGQLVRSHLGVAGDCALATVSERRLAAEILELGQPVRRLGEPELADRVVKSGRTTGVTRGLVQRVHVVARIDYGEAGEQDIGCFEIGPDPQDPGEDSELSRGGDSGAAWLLVQPDQPTDMLLGLHFAGEVADEPEHALACYASSVYEKLGVLPVPPELPDRATSDYDAGFLGTAVPLPAAADAGVESDLLVVAGTTVIPYTHYSLAMSRSRRFARWVAWNIDGAAIRRLSRSNILFVGTSGCRPRPRWVTNSTRTTRSIAGTSPVGRTSSGAAWIRPARPTPIPFSSPTSPPSTRGSTSRARAASGGNWRTRSSPRWMWPTCGSRSWAGRSLRRTTRFTGGCVFPGDSGRFSITGKETTPRCGPGATCSPKRTCSAPWRRSNCRNFPCTRWPSGRSARWSVCAYAVAKS